MKQQIIAIHGGDTFETYEEYLLHLKNYSFTLSGLTTRKWRERLDEFLGSEYEVLQPKMPNKNNAKYSEWKIWFEKLIPFTNDGVILLGHSMGGIFLAKYLSENKFPKKIKATLLVAPPFDTADATYSIGDFALQTTLKDFALQSEKIILYFSKDDDVVPFKDLGKYQKALPSATAKIFEDRGHFSQTEFPEIVEDIKSL
ncbi:MAG: alpha/beta fold hydrolase [Patescibacteria group bacterium]